MTLCKENKTLSSDNMPLSANNGMLLKRDKGCTYAQHTYTFYRSAEEILLLRREKIFPLRSRKKSSALKFSPRKDVCLLLEAHIYKVLPTTNGNPPTKRTSLRALLSEPSKHNIQIGLDGWTECQEKLK